jgi:hypothetical protein
MGDDRAEHSPRTTRAAALLAAAADANLPLAAVGGVAFELLCPSAQPNGRWSRSLADIDLATVSKKRRQVEALVAAQGFRPDTPFNMMNGSVRLRFFDDDESHLDVFIDEMRLCHLVDWRSALQPGMATVPLPQLLLSKLQIVKGEAKDFSDVSALLTDRWDETHHSRAAIDARVRKDWGLWHTASLNLEKLMASEDDVVSQRATELLDRWRGLRHSTRSRLRGVVGERVRWYEEPEEV